MGNGGELPMPPRKIKASEGYDTPGDFAFDEVIIGLIDLGKGILPGKKLIELELSSLIKLHQHVSVLANPGRSIERSRQALFLEDEGHDGDGYLLGHGGDTHGHAHSSFGETIEGLPDRCGKSDDLEGVIDPLAIRDRLDLVCHLRLRGIDEVRGPEG